MWAEILKILSVISLSTVKHTVGGIPLASAYGFSYIEVALYSAIGGTLGAFIFIWSAKYIKIGFRKLFPKKAKEKRIFTKKNRMIVRIKRSYGLIGIAFITPPLLSMPIGTIIAATMYKNKTRVFTVLFASVLFWSFLGATMSLIPLPEFFSGIFR